MPTVSGDSACARLFEVLGDYISEVLGDYISEVLSDSACARVVKSGVPGGCEVRATYAQAANAQATNPGYLCPGPS